MKNFITLSILAVSFIFFSCKNKQETISPERTDISESVYASGLLKSENQYEVFTTVNGVVETIFVKEGAIVKKGDPIFQIVNPNSKLSSENARLTALANDYKVNEDKLTDAKNAIELAKKRFTNDSLLYERQKSLRDQNIGAQVDFEQQALNYENAKVNLKKSKVAYDDLKRQLRLASDQSKNNLAIAEAIADDLIIKSAHDGVVYKLNIEEGELATSNAPLAIIGQENFLIELNIDELDIVKIKKGQKVIVRMDSYKSSVFEAVVSDIYPMMNERTRTFMVEALFSKKPDLLYPNLTLEANIIINEKEGVLTIPTNYLLNDSTVKLADGNKQKVKVGLKDYDLAEIENGLTETSQLVMPEE